MLRSLLSLMLCSSGLPAAAECLTPADLDRGVIVRFENSDSTVIRRIGPDQFAFEEFYANAGNSAQFIGPLALLPTQGIWGIPADDPSGGVPFRRSYGVDPGSFDPRQDNGLWYSRVHETDDAGGDYDMDVVVVVTAAAPVELSGCTYAAMTVDLRLTAHRPGTGTSRSWSLFLPELGVGFLYAAQSFGGDVFQSPPVAIEAMSKS
jgi:hypothetical protein